MTRFAALLGLALVPALMASGCGRAMAPSQAAQAAAAVKRPTAARAAATPAASAAKVPSPGTQPGAVAPAIAPQGTVVAFAVPGQGLKVAALDGSAPRAVAGSEPADADPAWTLAGDLLVAVRGSALVKLPPGGKAETLYAGRASLRSPAAVPAVGGFGGWLVVEAGTLVHVSATGAARPLAAAAGLASPAPAPDGKTAIVTVADGRGTKGTKLAVVALATGKLLPFAVAGENPRAARFSPAGDRVAYLADDGVYVASATGEGARRVSAARGLTGLAWHPAGARLVADGLARVEL